MKRMLVLILLVLTLAGCTSSGHSTPSTSPATPPSSTRAATAAAGVNPALASTWPRPLDKITPGDVVISCTYPRSTAERVVTQQTKDTAKVLYGYAGGSGLAFVEYDHRIPFALCGGNDLANIWPEPADGAVQSGFVHNRKDQLEAFAARQVHYGRWTLTFADGVFRGDWVAGWCKYIHSTGVKC